MSENRMVATLAGGCFWCTEAVFRRIRGVTEVVPGYTGGESANPTYDEVCGGASGHAEAVQITFDPDVVTFSELLEIFWQCHNPTTLNRQGGDVGTQYRSAIFCHDETQRAAAELSKRRAEAAGIWPDPIVTEIVPATTFYPAEEYHQNYHYYHRMQGYCLMIIDPKLRKLQQEFGDRLKNN